jgi:hypothetical protein
MHSQVISFSCSEIAAEPLRHEFVRKSAPLHGRDGGYKYYMDANMIEWIARYLEISYAVSTAGGCVKAGVV